MCCMRSKSTSNSGSEWERSQRHDKYCWTLWQNFFNVIASDKWAASLYGILIQTSIVTKTTHELCFVFDFDRKKNQCYGLLLLLSCVSVCVCVYVFLWKNTQLKRINFEWRTTKKNTNDFYENIWFRKWLMTKIMRHIQQNNYTKTKKKKTHFERTSLFFPRKFTSVPVSEFQNDFLINHLRLF